ncbi:hypothetical protein WSM22_05140 [Cytophagales bacterium WSM2-2]|nr:hypothetical protein WSM22_05140 [Cytophagales bacterium WSM2-2]
MKIVRDGKVFIDGDEEFLKPKPLRKDFEEYKGQENNHINNDQLNMAIIGAAKSIFKFLEHRSAVYDLTHQI